MLMFSQILAKNTFFKVISKTLLFAKCWYFRKYGQHFYSDHKNRPFLWNVDIFRHKGYLDIWEERYRDIKKVLFLESWCFQRYCRKNHFLKWSQKTCLFAKCWYFRKYGQNFYNDHKNRPFLWNVDIFRHKGYLDIGKER